MEGGRRVDLVAYEPDEQHFAVIEAKKFAEHDPRAIARDAGRIRDFVPVGRRCRRRFGLLVTQTINDETLAWWRTPFDRGARWEPLAAHLARVAAAGGVNEGAEAVAAWADKGGVMRRRHVLWSVWDAT